MNKIVLFFAILYVAFPAAAQEVTKEALTLATLSYEGELARRIQFLSDTDFLNFQKTEKKESPKTDELYKKLALVFQEQYTTQEISGLLAFYKTPLGAKTLSSQETIQNKAAGVINQWQLSQQGVDLDKLIPKFEDITKLLAQQQNDPPKTKESVLPPEDVFAKIATLEDLKKMLIKDPQQINNPHLLKSLVGEQEYMKILNPSFTWDKKDNDAVKSN